MPIPNQRAKRVNNAIMNRSGDIANIVEINTAPSYLNSPAHTHNHTKKAAIDMPTKNIMVPKSIGPASDPLILTRD
jgi:hypothetical protein